MRKALDNFDFRDLRERFYHESTTDKTGWPVTQVKVFDRDSSESEPIYEYERNFSMLKTFEPFRLWDENTEAWRHFALISPRYTNFEVLDLDNRTVIAENPSPLLDQRTADILNRSFAEEGRNPPYEAGQAFEGWRFCPRSFHVPDVRDILTERDLGEFKDAVEERGEDDLVFWEDWLSTFLRRRSFGFESGCVWGDDWSDKVRAIDLRGILEGKVSDDDRFGYFVLNGKLKDVYSKRYFDDEQPTLSLSTPVHFDFDEDDPSKTTKSYTYSELPAFSTE